MFGASDARDPDELEEAPKKHAHEPCEVAW